MGEVYRARDARLGRDVALKTLPEGFTRDPERRRRFEREARLLASLNHPNIAVLHGLEETGEILCLVMELVEGATLRERLANGPLRVSEALAVARQIAEGLEAAHERGVLHRDLKPGNVMVTPEGRVKLLDFGLAKAFGAEESEAAVSARPTAMADTTEAGVTLGTAPYMSPEQARGEALDRRTDVWAFGCVLYEMLSGRRAFPGPTYAEAVAAVLDREPDWKVLPPATPPSLRRLLRRTLEKERAGRLHDIGDARLEIEEAQLESTSGAGAATAALPRRRQRWLWVGGVLAAAAAVGFAVALALRSAPEAASDVRRLTLVPPAGVTPMSSVTSLQHLAVSPDGRRVAFVGRDAARAVKLYIQTIDDIEAQPVPGTEEAWTPFFSPDGRWLAFSQGGQLRKLRLDRDEGAVAIAAIPKRGSVRGASWGPDGTIVFSPGHLEGLWRVNAEGGEPRRLTTPDADEAWSSHRWPQVLPDGRHVIFTVWGGVGNWRRNQIGLLSLETAEWRVLLEGAGYARYSPTGHLVYGRLGALFAAPFDPARSETAGTAVSVLDDVQMDVYSHYYAAFDISASGSLAFVPGFPQPVVRSLLWVDREGRARPLSGARRVSYEPRLSPDGRQLVAQIESEAAVIDLWRFDVERDSWGRLTFDGSDTLEAAALWSPDGRALIFAAEGTFLRVAADGSAPAEPLSEPLGNAYPAAWSPDGRALVFEVQRRDTMWDIGVLDLATRETRWLLSAEYTECGPDLSPDGRFMAYTSNESGRYEIYVRRFDGPGAEKHLVSTDGGMQARWSRDGRELFYRGLGDRPKLMAVAVEPGGSFRASVPRPLFDDRFAERTSWLRAEYDVAPDGRSFVFVEEPPEAAGPTRLVLVRDWASELRAKLRAAG